MDEEVALAIVKEFLGKPGKNQTEEKFATAIGKIVEIRLKSRDYILALRANLANQTSQVDQFVTDALGVLDEVDRVLSRG